MLILGTKSDTFDAHKYKNVWWLESCNNKWGFWIKKEHDFACDETQM